MSTKFKIQFAAEMPLENGETNSGEIITEQAGYISPQRQIEDMILAGQRLDLFRSGYDFTTEEFDEDAMDNTRHPRYDMADAYQDNLRAMETLKDIRRKQAQSVPKPVEGEKNVEGEPV